MSCRSPVWDVVHRSYKYISSSSFIIGIKNMQDIQLFRHLFTQLTSLPC